MKILYLEVKNRLILNNKVAAPFTQLQLENLFFRPEMMVSFLELKNPLKTPQRPPSSSFLFFNFIFCFIPSGGWQDVFFTFFFLYYFSF